MQFTITIHPTQANSYQGEARISPDEYDEAGASDLCRAIARKCDAAGDDPNTITLRGYNDDREILFFSIH